MEVQTENLKSQTTEALKALLDYSIKQKEYFTSGVTVLTHGIMVNQGTGLGYDKEALTMYCNYSEIVRVLEDELGKRLEDIFLF